jgi:hypothetical protein
VAVPVVKSFYVEVRAKVKRRRPVRILHSLRSSCGAYANVMGEGSRSGAWNLFV